jgi:hypothetical protein
MQIRILLAIAAILTIGLTATAKATIPNSQTGVYTACYSNANGAMRVIDFEAKGLTCTAGEKAMGWNAAGPKGATGAQGPAGPKGATGAQGPAGISFARGHFRTSRKMLNHNWTTYATVDLPKGMHTVMGKAVTHQDELLGFAIWTEVGCRLVQRSAAGAETVIDVAQTEVGDNDNESATMAMMGFAYVPEGTDKLHLQCERVHEVGYQDNWVDDIKVIAQQVGGYTALAN